MNSINGIITKSSLRPTFRPDLDPKDLGFCSNKILVYRHIFNNFN